MGPGYLSDFRGYLEAASKIKRAISIDASNAYAYRTLGLIASDAQGYNQAQKLFQKSLSLDSTAVEAWLRMGDSWLFTIGDVTADKKAEQCYRKSILLDSTYFRGFTGLGAALYHQGKFKEAHEEVEKAFYIDSEDIHAIAATIVILEALGDTLAANNRFKIASKRDPIELGRSLNTFAYSLEIHKKYKTALRYVQMALKADSVSREAGYSYSTLAELCGLQNDKEGFYLNLEKGSTLGFPMSTELEQTEPYVRFKDEERYKKLKAKYPK